MAVVHIKPNVDLDVGCPVGQLDNGYLELSFRKNERRRQSNPLSVVEVKTLKSKCHAINAINAKCPKEIKQKRIL